MSRTCARGHIIAEDYLRVCPHCGSPVQGAPSKKRSLAAEHPAPADVPKLKPFLAGAFVLLLFGILLTSVAVSGPAEVFGWLLLASAVAVGATGVLDHVRRSR